MNRAWLAAIVMPLAGVGCRDLQRFSTAGDHFEGDIAKASFVRAGFADDVRVCLTLDADHLQENPGTISTSDGRLRGAALRPIPQLWSDPLSTLEFGQGRIKNVVYAAAQTSDGGAGDDLMVVVSLMESNDVEVRMLRGAPPIGDAGPANNLFGVFKLERRGGPCAF